MAAVLLKCGDMAHDVLKRTIAHVHAHAVEVEIAVHMLQETLLASVMRTSSSPERELAVVSIIRESTFSRFLVRRAPRMAKRTLNACNRRTTTPLSD